MLKKYLRYIWQQAERDYNNGILELIKVNKRGKILDLGCDDGKQTLKFARKAGASKGRIFGIDIIKARYEMAIERGIKVVKSDLNKKFPFKDNGFNLVFANQVIEHLWDLDNFVSEIYRVLTIGGEAIICTENLSSWHNLFALALGIQPFSLTNISFKGAIGNPFSLHASDPLGAGMSGHAPWHHTRVLSFSGLKDIFEKYGFKIVKFTGHGYFPFPPPTARFLAARDARHAAFLVLKAQKI